MSPISRVEPFGEGGRRASDAEELAFEDLGGQGRAVDRQQGGLRGRALLVDRPPDQPLARAGLAHDQDGDRRGDGRPDLVEQAAVGGAEADEVLEPISVVEPLADLQQLDPEAMGVGVGDEGRGLGFADPAEEAEEPPFVVVDRPEFHPPPASVRRRAWRISVGPPDGLPASASGGG